MDTAWTEVGDLNLARHQITGSGLSSSALMFGGEPGPAATANNESWDNSSWTELANLSTARGRSGSGGTSTAAFCASGTTNTGPTVTTATEEWDFTSTLGAGAWATGGMI